VALTGDSLAGTAALVTGGAVGIGRAIALALAGAGADVAITCLSHDGAEVAGQVEAMGRTAAVLPLDATDSAAVDRAVAEAADRLGGSLDVVVNNAGGLLKRVTVAEMSDDHWRRLVDTNLTSAVYVTRAALRHMERPGGRIVFISSLAARHGGAPGAAAYAATKAGLEGLTRGLAKELAPRSIRVNAVVPGFILGTPFHEKFTTPEGAKAAIDATLVGRAGCPEDVANAVLYLVSDLAGFVTGEALEVNGGAWFH
jgi:3-oxoacyl-[acyl-carrier protein] reductase